MKKRIESLEEQQPKDSKKLVISLGQKWNKARGEGDEEAAKQAREKAEHIFKDHPELRNNQKLRMNLDLFGAWHKFVSTPYKKELVAAFEKWKQAPSGEKQEAADNANNLWLELTGQEIPFSPMFGEGDSYKEFWETGVRYAEKLQKIREEQEQKFA